MTYTAAVCSCHDKTAQPRVRPRGGRGRAAERPGGTAAAAAGGWRSQLIGQLSSSWRPARTVAAAQAGTGAGGCHSMFFFAGLS